MSVSAQAPNNLKHLPMWIALLTIASTLFSLSFACATPLAAFAAAAALSLPRKHAMTLVACAWLANQIIGYTILGYPQNPNSFIWGAVIGGAALLATYVCFEVKSRFEIRSTAALTVAMFITAVLTYQVVMLVALFTPLGSIADFNYEMIRYVVVIDIAAFIALLVVNALGKSVGIIPQASKQQS